jgi:hypothetical protein
MEEGMNTDVFSIRMSKDDKDFLADMAKKTKDSMAGVMNSIFFYGKEAYYKEYYLPHVAERKYLMEFFHLTEDDVKDKDFELSEYQTLYSKMNDARQEADFYNKVYAERQRLEEEYMEKRRNKD